MDNPEYSPDYFDIRQHGSQVGVRASGLLASELGEETKLYKTHNLLMKGMASGVKPTGELCEDTENCKWLQKTNCRQVHSKVPKQEIYQDCQWETYQVGMGWFNKKFIIIFKLFIFRIVTMSQDLKNVKHCFHHQKRLAYKGYKPATMVPGVDKGAHQQKHARQVQCD